MTERRAYRPRELPAMLGVSRTQAYRWLRTGQIPSVKVDGTVLILAEDLEAWLKSLRVAR